MIDSMNEFAKLTKKMQEAQTGEEQLDAVGQLFAQGAAFLGVKPVNRYYKNMKKAPTIMVELLHSDGSTRIRPLDSIDWETSTFVAYRILETTDEYHADNN